MFGQGFVTGMGIDLFHSGFILDCSQLCVQGFLTHFN